MQAWIDPSALLLQLLHVLVEGMVLTLGPTRQILFLEPVAGSDWELSFAMDFAVKVWHWVHANFDVYTQSKFDIVVGEEYMCFSFPPFFELVVISDEACQVLVGEDKVEIQRNLADRVDSSLVVKELFENVLVI
jgi:hypothetical protein